MDAAPPLAAQDEVCAVCGQGPGEGEDGNGLATCDNCHQWMHSHCCGPDAANQPIAFTCATCKAAQVSRVA